MKDLTKALNSSHFTLLKLETWYSNRHGRQNNITPSELVRQQVEFTTIFRQLVQRVQCANSVEILDRKLTFSDIFENINHSNPKLIRRLNHCLPNVRAIAHSALERLKESDVTVPPLLMSDLVQLRTIDTQLFLKMASNPICQSE